MRRIECTHTLSYFLKDRKKHIDLGLKKSALKNRFGKYGSEEAVMETLRITKDGTRIIISVLIRRRERADWMLQL